MSGKLASETDALAEAGSTPTRGRGIGIVEHKTLLLQRLYVVDFGGPEHLRTVGIEVDGEPAKVEGHVLFVDVLGFVCEVECIRIA